MLLLAALFEYFGYRQILTFERFRAMWQIRRKRGMWGQQARTGIPAPIPTRRVR